MYNLHTWYKWADIFKLLPIAVFDRPNYKNISLSSKTAQKFKKFKYLEKFAKKLPLLKSPAWIYFHGKQNYKKSSIMRKNEK